MPRQLLTACSRRVLSEVINLSTQLVTGLKNLLLHLQKKCKLLHSGAAEWDFSFPLKPLLLLSSALCPWCSWYFSGQTPAAKNRPKNLLKKSGCAAVLQDNDLLELITTAPTPCMESLACDFPRRHPWELLECFLPVRRVVIKEKDGPSQQLSMAHQGWWLHALMGAGCYYLLV